jgi:hypothetical protein
VMGGPAQQSVSFPLFPRGGFNFQPSKNFPFSR